MGQKANPIGLRLIRNKNWRSKWYANKQEFGSLLIEDTKIRDYLKNKPACQGASMILIRRMSEKIEVTIATARPGLVIGKKGAEIDVLKAELSKMTGKEVWIEVEEIKRPDLDARIVADGIAKQLERRIPFRRAMKKAIQSTIDAGALGIKVQVSGRLGGAEIARTEWYKEGSIPLHTLRADIDFAKGRAETTYGSIGVKVWINRGDDDRVKKEGA
ncbi:30S ribosomal protein S3 [Criblamydia sequanensis]|uniref:Small ribosomal subunit protein uS3 n=1 Tax=Candidatus Criblamydia sequanensis CRIB-18 TaxID=1437425 RepID=A0A090DVR8_9BACT|nr:30S ribosomal protein S3 [Criblamydia sequanensis]CDR33059.1 30S ribosomal protein S3 [Criblamydia sequanensis CRIB-18]